MPDINHASPTSEGVRKTEANVNSLFPDRWSPRSFDSSYNLSESELQTVLEAARWSPSSFNEQPWTFHFCLRKSPAFPQFLDVLADSNRVWAKDCSALAFISGKRRFSKNNKDNTTFEFDCGAAWMSLTLQARLLGLYTHGMVGFSREKAADLLGLSADDEKVIAALAIGKKDTPEKLPENLRANEKMNSRKTLKEVYKTY